jgi:membrane-bound metal-dependent hydrolase YbcI (DUF457 family)
MPFTPSHVAAVLPFARTPLYPAALVIGSMGPDLFYYVPLPISRTFTHSLAGVFTVDLALGILGFVLWQLVFRRPLVDYAPLGVRRRIAAIPWDGMRPRGAAWWRVALILLASVLLGTLTHVLWDSFTHAGATATAIGWLDDQWGPLPAYKWAQYFSTVFGAVVIVIWAIVWWRRTTPTDAAATRVTSRLRLAAWVTVLGIGLGVALVVWIPLGILRGISAVNPTLLFHTTTIGIAAAGLIALIWSVAWWAARPRTEIEN